MVRIVIDSELNINPLALAIQSLCRMRLTDVQKMGTVSPF
jgi:hypothetical protein